MTDQQQIGANLYHLGAPVEACDNWEEIAGWLQAANAAWLAQHQATQADHERLCETMAQVVEEERTGKRILCVGHVEPVTREIVVTLAEAEFDEYLAEAQTNPVQHYSGYDLLVIEDEQIGSEFCNRPFLF